jgi:hypothetical protein
MVCCLIVFTRSFSVRKGLKKVLLLRQLSLRKLGVGIFINKKAFTYRRKGFFDFRSNIFFE